MTQYFLNTNVLLRLSDSTATNHSLVLSAVVELLRTGHDCVITGQSLIEFWVVVTRLFRRFAQIQVVHPSAIG